MMLIVLDKDPRRSADLVPDKIKFKQLIELSQLICSAGISDVYKAIPQGKELNRWVYNNKKYALYYHARLLKWAINNIKMKPDTISNLFRINADLCLSIKNWKDGTKYAVFRYSKGYTNTEYESGTELPIKECIKEYEKYVQWKGSKWQ